MAREPAPALPGMPILDPGWLETTMPVPLPLPPLSFGGAATDPASIGPPRPEPRLPRPRPDSEPASETAGGGGTAETPPPKPVIVGCCKEPPPTWTGGGTTLALPKPATARGPVALPFNCTGGGTTVTLPTPLKAWCALGESAIEAGGGTTWFCNEPAPYPGPRGSISRATCVTGGAITAGAGRVSRGFRLLACSGAETGGGMTLTACEPDRGTKISRRGAVGLGGTIAAFNGCAERICSRCASGVGGMIFAFNIGVRCAFSFRTSGVGATADSERFGARSEGFSPSDGAGPGTGLNARRLVTAESDCGSFSLGASTTLSRTDSPRATRMVWVR